MYEYTIENRQTHEETYIFGFNVADAFARSKLNRDDWRVVCAEYVD